MTAAPLAADDDDDRRLTAFDAPHFLRATFRQPPVAGGYPLAIPAVRDLERIEFHPVTFPVGENGSGKSTLVEALAGLMGMNPEGGSENFTSSTRASHSPLADLLGDRLGTSADGGDRA